MGGMMTDNLISEGLELMVFGMSTVLVFLTLLVFSTMLMSALVRRFFPEPDLADTASSGLTSAPAGDPKLLAVITAAIHKHRSRP
jgi:oxaloacetate decarboxylase gamma subunit